MSKFLYLASTTPSTISYHYNLVCYLYSLPLGKEIHFGILLVYLLLVVFHVFHFLLHSCLMQTNLTRILAKRRLRLPAANAPKWRYAKAGVFLYQVSADAPQVSPAPNPASTILFPLCIIPRRLTKSNKIGMLPAEIFPHVCKFMGIFSMGILRRYETDCRMRIFA